MTSPGPLPATGAGWRRRWLSSRALALHLAVVVAVPGCLLAAWWQATQAMSGNTLSYLYAVEWPVFAALSVVGWWQLLHMPPPRQAPEPLAPEAGTYRHGRPAPPPTWDRAGESPQLREYNRRLEEMASGGAGARPRRRRIAGSG